MSATEPAELRAFRELEGLVRHLGEELAVFRKRALAAEAQLKDAGHDAPKIGHAGAPRETDLEAVNRELRRRVEHAEGRVRQLMERVRFLRQQIQASGAAAGRP